jgi:hypothetical protein
MLLRRVLALRPTRWPRAEAHQRFVATRPRAGRPVRGAIARHAPSGGRSAMLAAPRGASVAVSRLLAAARRRLRTGCYPVAAAHKASGSASGPLARPRPHRKRFRAAREPPLPHRKRSWPTRVAPRLGDPPCRPCGGPGLSAVHALREARERARSFRHASRAACKRVRGRCHALRAARGHPRCRRHAFPTASAPAGSLVVTAKAASPASRSGPEEPSRRPPRRSRRPRRSPCG